MSVVNKNRDDLRMPEGLTPEGRRTFSLVAGFLRRRGLTYTAGCRVFFPPGAVPGATLLVAHEGELALALEDPLLREDLETHLAKNALSLRPCGPGWTAVCPLE